MSLATFGEAAAQTSEAREADAEHVVRPRVSRTLTREVRGTCTGTVATIREEVASIARPETATVSIVPSPGAAAGAVSGAAAWAAGAGRTAGDARIVAPATPTRTIRIRADGSWTTLSHRSRGPAS